MNVDRPLAGAGRVEKGLCKKRHREDEFFFVQAGDCFWGSFGECYCTTVH